jgi:hypothetical protein
VAGGRWLVAGADSEKNTEGWMDGMNYYNKLRDSPTLIERLVNFSGGSVGSAHHYFNYKPYRYKLHFDLVKCSYIA